MSEATTYAIDTTHSAIVFRVKHMGVSYAYGFFEAFSGEVQFDEKDPTKSSIVIEVDAASVDTNNGKRDDHLRSPDFLSAKEFPVIVFESKKVAKKGDRLAVTGDLTFHGVTKEVTAEVEHVGSAAGRSGEGQRIGMEATFEILPKDFEVAYMQESSGLGPEVRLTVSLACESN